MRWEMLGWCAVALLCAACGESAGNKPSAATAGASGGGAGNPGTAGSTSGTAAVAGNASGGSAGSGTGVGMCSGSSNQTGGTRIKRKIWLTAEGDRSWDTFWDSELNAACDFDTAADGVMRCMPNNWSGNAEVFADELCTQPLYTRLGIGPCETADCIVQYAGGTCEMPGGSKVFKLGSLATPAGVFSKTGAGCMTTPLPEEPLYAKGEEVPPTTFLAGTPADFGPDTRIKARGVAAADGTKMVFGWRDTQLAGESCYFALAEDGKMRCLPSGAQIAGYADATCSVPVLQDTPRCDMKVSTYAQTIPDYNCGTDQRSLVYKRGDALIGTRYVGTPESCMPGEPLPNAMLLQSTLAPAETFQEVTATVDESDPGRLKPRYYDGGSAGCWFHDFWDAQLKHACHFDTATDSKQRCLPSGAIQVLPLYSDEACTAPAALAPVSDCTPDPLPEFSTNTIPADDCERRSQVYRIGEEVLGASLPPLWSNYGFGCAVYVPSAEKYRKLTIVEPNEFMAGEPVIE